MHEDIHFVRVKDYKLGILNKYRFPAWVKNDSRMKYLNLLLAHKDTESVEVVKYYGEHLFHPENLFHSSLDQTRLYNNRVQEVLNELNAFKRLSNGFKHKSITFHDINPEHDIQRLFLNYLMEKMEEPVIVLKGKKALVGNARELGFGKEFVETNRFKAFQLNKIKLVKPAKRRLIKTTNATKICEF